MHSHPSNTTIRRSVALPASLAREALELARQEKIPTFNGLVRTLLERFVQGHKAASFAKAMAEMAHDPAIQRESDAIAREFAHSETDGLAGER